jgi:hypothetical protein
MYIVYSIRNSFLVIVIVYIEKTLLCANCQSMKKVFWIFLHVDHCFHHTFHSTVCFDTNRLLATRLYLIVVMEDSLL